MSLPVANPDLVTVRMYNVGFGDCFLITFPTEGRRRKVLIDCGTLPNGGAPHPIGDVVDQLIADVSDDGHPHIDIIVATHRHHDHVSGFANVAWGEVEVGEVWLPWTEDPKDPQAKSIRDAQSRIALQMNQRLSSTRTEASLLNLSLNSEPNKAAMRTLLKGFAGNPRRRFLPSRRRDRKIFLPKLLPGVLVRCFGPSHDPDVIRDMNPPDGQSYLRFIDETDNAPTDIGPFQPRWFIEPNDFRNAYENLSLNDDERAKIDGVGFDRAPEVVVALDKAINGTSLMLMFSIGNAHLLFPGDAQWGTWRQVLADEECRDALKLTTFYKVGHHGSHNATPVDFVENVLADNDNFWAMTSTHTIKTWPHIPKIKLLESLQKKSKKTIRSDLPVPNPVGFTVHKNLWIDAEIPIK